MNILGFLGFIYGNKSACLESMQLASSNSKLTEVVKSSPIFKVPRAAGLLMSFEYSQRPLIEGHQRLGRSISCCLYACQAFPLNEKTLQSSQMTRLLLKLLNFHNYSPKSLDSRIHFQSTASMRLDCGGLD